MLKYSAIICITILMLTLSVLSSCGSETEKIEQKRKVVSNKIGTDQTKKSNPTAVDEEISIKKKNENNDTGSKDDKSSPDLSVEKQAEIVDDPKTAEGDDGDKPIELDAENEVLDTDSEDIDSEDIDVADIKSQNENILDEEKRKAAELLASIHQEANQNNSDRENRLDRLINPFLPLFSDVPVPPQTDDKDDRPKPPPTPLTQVDLSQFKLVATLRASSGNKALVEDSTGKGYVVDKGTLIGINFGRVVEITNDSVIVDEEIKNITGDYDIKRREIKLQKAPGE